ncbi:unnamed protein product [Paramecium sonneborni]|uniref:Uncharacterized protein n=1 Tax=Paramecium sonneborni TaxID=65129 RepID=A0A8S1QX10_9CILI|nr:unnamed protein product [Paramecium sonneborni]
MGNGACHQQVPSIDEVNLVARNFKQQFEPSCENKYMLPLLNSQCQSPSKPSIESKNPTIARLEEDEFEISITNEDKQIEEDLSPVRNTKLSRAQSPTKLIKTKQHYKQEEVYFLELLKQDKTNLTRRKSADRQLSPVKVIHTGSKKHNTALLINSPNQRSNQLIKMNRLSCQLDEAVIISIEPKSILKSIGSEKSLTNSQKSKTNSQKRVRFGMVYRQYK